MQTILILLIIALPLLAQFKVKNSYEKYSSINNSSQMTGQEVARKILDANGLSNVKISQIGGELTDHYDPSQKIIRLSQNIYSSTSISAAAVAAHEVGHAIQHKEEYSFLTFRTKLVPVVNFTSRISSVIIVLGFILEAINVINIALLLMLVSLLFQFVTLPVEFDASNRAKLQLKKLGLIKDADSKGINNVLSAAALTYVAGFLATALQILRLFLASRDRN